MEDNGGILQCIDGGVLEAVRRGRGCSGRGVQLQSVVATAQRVARALAWKNQPSKPKSLPGYLLVTLSSLVKMYLSVAYPTCTSQGW